MDEFDEVLERLLKIENISVEAGFLENAPHPESDLGCADLAIIHNYGLPAKNIPPRPFMWKAFQDRHERWEKVMVREVEEYLDGKRELHLVGHLTGGQMEVDIQEAIKSDISPPNKKSTLMRKLAKHGGEYRGTLRDTETMMKAVSYEVKNE